MRKLEYILKHNPFIMKIFIAIGSTFFKVMGVFIKTDDRLILFSSFSGKQYNDSPKAIYEYINSIPDGKNYECVWAFTDSEKFGFVNCKKVKIDTPQYFITALKAKYWVTNVNIERGLKFKKKNTVYLNTWHGAAINLVGNAVQGRSDFNWNHIDYFCVSGKYEEPFIIRDFKVNRESLLFSGLPRNDELYSVTECKKSELRKKYFIPEGKKVILYAPTWRESTDGGESCNLKPPIDLAKWQKTLGEEYVLIIRTHVNTSELLGVKYNDFVKNGSDCPAVNELLIIADYLISDYSSIIMDYCILGRPIICFGYDYDEYCKMRGGFYFDLDKEIPSGVLRNEDDVLSYILHTDYSEESKKVCIFRDNYIEVGGNATEICVKSLFN